MSIADRVIGMLTSRLAIYLKHGEGANNTDGMGVLGRWCGSYHDQVSSSIFVRSEADQSDYIQECRIHTTSSSIRQSTISAHHHLNPLVNSVVEEQHSKEQTCIEVFISTFQSIVRK
jgi:hypothetical protein